MDSCEFATFVTAIACSIVNCCSEEEVSLFIVVFTQLADTLDTIVTRNEICNADGSLAK